ncbi:beta-ketoacyl synthase N-terminal-like domain-containing protein [Modestobacter versicolor]|uniref:beta-ketoacyl synthase N-terminal-like domain-containing protein n=1 Tax=Modestobacter versicolor TaxID=429133 RepID=UPI0034DFC0A1
MTIVPTLPGPAGTQLRDEHPDDARSRTKPQVLARITGWAMHSPAGDTPPAAAQSVLAGASCASAVDPATAGPYARACRVPDFDRVRSLGRKGTRTMDRATALAVATVAGLGPDVVGHGRPDAVGTGLVLGTAMGSVQSTMDFTRDALTGDRPYLVDPARFPNTVMNFAAGQCAIWHGLRGPNATVIAGRVTGVAAVRYAIRLLTLGHARRVITGAVEELSPQRGWLESHLPGGPERLLGEGCGVLLLEPAETGTAGPVGDVVAVETGLAASPEATRRVLGRVAAAALDALPPGAVLDVHAPYDDRPGSVEADALTAALGGRPRPRVLPTTTTLGDSGAASAVLQTQVALGALHLRSTGRDGYALVTSLDTEGVVGALLLRHQWQDAPR